MTNMMKTRVAITIILLALFMVCSCKMEPKLSDEEYTVARVGIRTESQIANNFNKNGSYSGVYQTSTGNGTVYYNYNNATAIVDCSDLGLGTISVRLTGQVRCTFPDYPSMYPNIYTYNISYTYSGKSHTLEYEVKYTGASSSEITRLKVDGIMSKGLMD